MKKYIPTLMEVYQEMIKENEETDKKIKQWKSGHPDLHIWECDFGNKYSDTMLHNLISIINKLNNHKR